VIVKVKHELPPHVVKDKLIGLLEAAVKEHARVISAHKFIWTENSCDIILSAINMQFKGNLEISKEDVLVDVKVPLIFHAYQSKIKKLIGDELNKILK
jgi:Putative polyhydroxyalkanoic acid system protein (PHA_gran_rgn)